MNNNYLHTKILEVKDEFATILKEYQKSKFVLECEDDEYKDSEDNIFEDSRRYKLEQFIAKEAQLYRDSSLRYDEMLETVKQLSTDITNWLRAMRGRAGQGMSQVQKIYNSEKYYLKDMRIRLSFFAQVLDCLCRLEQFETDSLGLGIELSADSEYDAYLLNKCILLSQVGYCRQQCTKLIKELNNRVSNSPLYNADFYYKLAEINFELQKYKDAQCFIDKAINVLKNELKSGRIEKQRCYQIHDMLFSAYQLKVLGYEFCGEYRQALLFLTGKTPEELVSIFKDALHEKKLEQLYYSSDCEGKYFRNAETKRTQVICKIGKILEKNLFPSEMAAYVYDKDNQTIISELIEDENQKTRSFIKECVKEEFVDKVYKPNAIDAEDVNVMYEYIHILAHCINEYGVTFFKKDKPESEDFANCMILIGRALMLYVSEKRAIYKSCYATTYAEAGDTWIAKNELKRIIQHEDYAGYDVTTKAEIAFFYYIINSMFLIENSEFGVSDDFDSGLSNRYLNYCYRNFDYDAITHMRVYSFRNKIAELLQTGDISTMARRFLSFAKQQESGKTVYQEFVDAVYFQNSNARLKCEYEKAKYMYQFLLCFFMESPEFPNEQVVRSPQTLDFAFKYLHHYNASINNAAGQSISYVSFDDIHQDTEILTQVINNTEYSKNIVMSEHCRLVLLNSLDDVNDFADNALKYDTEAHSRMFFIACKDSSTSEEARRLLKLKDVQIYPRFRIFDSLVDGMKEFIVFSTFFTIKDDFFNPNNIFVMTPIGTAKACRYRISNNIDLIDNCFAPKSEVSVGIQKEISTQYRAVAESMSREKMWESALNAEKYRSYVSYIVSITYDRNSNSNAIKYKYKYDVSDSWREARLFSSSKWKSNMERIYSRLKYECSPIKSHISECSHGGAYCSVVLIDNIDTGAYDVNVDDNDFVEVVKAFVNIGDNTCQKALVWRGTNNSHVSWRLISLSKNCPENIINEIRQIMCCKGQELVFAPIQDMFGKQKYQWPAPHNYLQSEKSFLFLSHAGRDDDLVKQELNEFFEKHSIPVWYDKDKLVRDDTWKQRVAAVINNEHCAGIVILVTNSSFFESEAIQFELKTATEKKIRRQDFAFLPIVYGVFSNNNELSASIITSIINSTGDDETALKIKKAVLPTRDKVITYLCPNQLLDDYTENEKSEGRDGSVLAALYELGVISKKA